MASWMISRATWISRDKWEDKTLTSPFLEAELEDGNIRKGEDETANGPISRNSHRTSVGHPTYSGAGLGGVPSTLHRLLTAHLSHLFPGPVSTIK